MLLSLEKFVQHMVVSYAFLMDVPGTRQFVRYDYRIFLVAGLVVGVLFLASFVLMVRRKRSGFVLSLALALFDFVGEFVAQGTLTIKITVSFIVASIMIAVYLFSRESRRVYAGG